MASMKTRLFCLLVACALAACSAPTSEDYRAFVEEDGLLIPSVEAVLAFPAVPREPKS
jgi:hypothetical protein